MARILKITSGLMGVLLLVMVGVMGVGRYDQPLPKLMVVMSHSNDRLWLDAIAVGRKRTFKMTPTFRNIELNSPKPSDHWIYLRMFGGGDPYATGIYHLSLDGSHFERLTHYFPRAKVYSISPDEEWIAYRPDAQSTQRISTARIDDAAAVNVVSEDIELTTRVDLGIDPSSGQPQHFLWSLDSQWLFFVGKRGDEQPNLFRACPNGACLEQLTHLEWGQNISLTHWITDEWLIISINERFYQMRLDGSQMSPLLDYEQPFREDIGESILATFREGTWILILSADSRQVMLSIADNREIWRQSDFWYSTGVMGESALIFADYTSLVWVAMDTGIVTDVWTKPIQPEFRQMAWLTATDEKLIYQANSPDWSTNLLYSTNPDFSGTVKLATADPRSRIETVTPDGEWVVYSGWVRGEGTKLYAVPIKGGSSILMTPPGCGHQVIGWLQYHSPPMNQLPLLVGASGFCMVPILLSHLRRRFHPGKV